MDDLSTCTSCKRVQKDIRKLRSRLEAYQVDETASNERQIHRSEISIYNLDTGKKVKLRPTHIWCGWCCHPFDTLPYALPMSYYDGAYYVAHHLFCSPNCSLARSASMRDTGIMERKTLVRRMYREMHKIAIGDLGDLSEAPPREMLTVFGGTLSIEEYRALLRKNKKFTIYCPPVRTIQFVIEERAAVEQAELQKTDTSANKAGSFLV